VSLVGYFATPASALTNGSFTIASSLVKGKVTTVGCAGCANVLHSVHEPRGWCRRHCGRQPNALRRDDHRRERASNRTMAEPLRRVDVAVRSKTRVYR